MFCNTNLISWSTSSLTALFWGPKGGPDALGTVKRKEDTEDREKGGKQETVHTLPQTGYGDPLRGILESNASKALVQVFHTNTTLFL